MTLNSLYNSFSTLRDSWSRKNYHSKFGGTWLDLPNAHQKVDTKLKRKKLSPLLAEALHHFIDHGYVIFPRAVDSKLIDKYLLELDELARTKNQLKASIIDTGPAGEQIVPLTEEIRAQPSIKILDSYIYAHTARQLIFSESIRSFLRAVFEEDILAFQALHFETGSGQVMHQDTAYVVLDDPMKLCASWIALEDISPGTGELRYYRGSHRLPDWIYSDKYKHFNHERDGHDAHLNYLGWLDSESSKRGFDLQYFLPKKGDVLIWAADLVHGGTPIQIDTKTRRSLVTHYCNFHNTPNYFHYKPKAERNKYRHKRGTYFSTMHYNSPLL